MTVTANPVRVAGGTVRSDLVAISTFYEWAHRTYGVTNPVLRQAVRGHRGREVTAEAYQATPHISRLHAGPAVCARTGP